ncbi:galactose mutarotase-like protein [Ramaria rubella]|nr:galactose mutarotase-like protein [Ramaria rubella]
MANPVLLALPDLSPPLAVEILPKGLVVNRFLVNADGKTHDLVIGPNNPAHHGQDPHKYQNTVIGRYSNRIPTGSLPIAKNGATATVNPIPNESPKVSLHGGPEGFDTHDWQPIDITDATLFSEKEKESIASLPSSAVFKHVSPDGDQGFPGRLLLEVLFALSSAPTKSNGHSEPYHVGSLYIVYRAKLLSENNSEVTPINLTQHWGFNLDASLAEKGTPTPDIKNHRLFIKADHTIALDDSALSTGKLTSVIGTSQEHAHTHLGNNFPPKGHDSFYVFNIPPTPIESIRLPLTKLQSLDLFKDVLLAPARTNPLVKLSSERSGWTLAFDSNQPGVQFYTANFLDASKGTRKPIHGWSGKDGDGYGPHTFAFLEFHEPLAAWLHPETAVSGDTLLTADELYNNFVRVDVMFKQPPRAESDDA